MPSVDVISKSDKVSTLPVASKPIELCNKGSTCPFGNSCRFEKGADHSTENLRGKKAGGNKSAAGGGAAPAPKKKVQPVDIHHTQICARNVRSSDCPLCSLNKCNFAANFEILAAAHAREIKKNSDFTINVMLRPELEEAPYNGVPKGNGKIALTPSAYAEWFTATMMLHASKDELLNGASFAIGAAYQAGANDCAAAYVTAVAGGY